MITGIRRVGGVYGVAVSRAGTRPGGSPSSADRRASGQRERRWCCSHRLDAGRQSIRFRRCAAHPRWCRPAGVGPGTGATPARATGLTDWQTGDEFGFLPCNFDINSPNRFRSRRLPLHSCRRARSRTPQAELRETVIFASSASPTLRRSEARPATSAEGPAARFRISGHGTC